MKLSALEGKPVISARSAQKVGTVDDALADSSQWKIVALKIKPLKRGPDRIVSAEHVRAIGRDAVIIDSQDSLLTPEMASGMANLKSLSSLMHCRVITEGGEVLGTVYDLDLDPTSRQLTGILYDGGPLAEMLRRQHVLNPTDVIGSGPGIVTVTEAARPRKAA